MTADEALREMRFIRPMPYWQGKRYGQWADAIEGELKALREKVEKNGGDAMGVTPMNLRFALEEAIRTCDYCAELGLSFVPPATLDAYQLKQVSACLREHLASIDAVIKEMRAYASDALDQEDPELCADINYFADRLERVPPGLENRNNAPQQRSGDKP